MPVFVLVIATPPWFSLFRKILASVFSPTFPSDHWRWSHGSRLSGLAVWIQSSIMWSCAAVRSSTVGQILSSKRYLRYHVGSVDREYISGFAPCTILVKLGVQVCSVEGSQHEPVSRHLHCLKQAELHKLLRWVCEAVKGHSWLRKYSFFGPDFVMYCISA